MATRSPARQRAAAPEPTPTPAPDRKAQIIRAAEALFAQYGYHAVTIRQIAEQAQVPLALVRYYYGAKDELFHAIFERWNHVNAQRLALLAEALQDSPPPRLLRRVVQAFAGPVLALLGNEEGRHYAVLLARELAHPTEESLRARRDFFDGLARAFLDALQRALPHAGAEQLSWCYQYMLGAVMAHVQETEHQRVHGLAGVADAAPQPDSGRLLADFVVGGLTAAIPRTAAGPARTAPRQRAAA